MVENGIAAQHRIQTRDSHLGKVPDSIHLVLAGSLKYWALQPVSTLSTDAGDPV